MNMDAHNQSNASFADESARMRAINGALGERRLTASPLARCIAPMMIALDWFGAPRRLIVSLPPEDAPIGHSDLGKMLADQGFRMRTCSWSEWRRQAGAGLDALPVGSLLLSGDRVWVYLGRLDNADWWHDGTTMTTDVQPLATDTLLHIEEDADFQPLDGPQVGWFHRLLLTARHEIGGILFISLIANLLALAISLFTMFVYNTVIPSGAANSLWAMTAGAVIAIIGAWGLRLARLNITTRLSAWAGLRISDIAMSKTLSLPLDVSARAGVENNLIRLRSLEGVRQWFGGAGGVVNIDYPFVVIFLVVIALLGGWIVIVPITGLLLFTLVSWPLARVIEARSSKVSRVSRRLGEFTAVITKRLRALRGVRGSALWDRYLSELVAQTVVANRDHALATALTQTLGQALGMLTVLATMGVGIALVLAGDMNTGGLIATMMLIWRITTPAQQMFASKVRIKQLIDAGRQLQRLLESTGEASNPRMTSPVADLKPAAEADRLYYRYSADREPALNGVSFEVPPGLALAVVGPNGAGKTTLLELMAGARMPQNGRVRIDGRDVRQFDPSDYRSWHGYLPQMMPGLPISLPESLRLRNPSVTDVQLMDALEQVAGPTWWTYFGAESAEAAFNISISPWREDRDAVRGRYIVRMAAAILGTPPLLLLDDPLGDQDPILDAYFMRVLDNLKGKTTVILATHRPDLIQRCDLIAVLDDGALAHFGPIAAPEAEEQETVSEEIAP